MPSALAPAIEVQACWCAMGANGTPRVWRCSVTRVITPPLISPGNRAYRGYALTAHGGYRPAGGGRGRMIAGSLRRSRPGVTQRLGRGSKRDGQDTSRPLPPGSHGRGQVSAAPRLHIAVGQVRSVRVAAPGLRG